SGFGSSISHANADLPATTMSARCGCTSARTLGSTSRWPMSPSRTLTASTAKSRWHMRESNPAKGIERNIEYHRRRYLSGDELVRLTKALAKHPDKKAADAIRLLLLTGARRGEVLGMRWEHLDLGTGVWSKPASSTKQKEAHEVSLSAPARQLLADIRK